MGTMTRPIYIGSEIYRRSTYGSRHPLAIPRVSTVTDLIRAMGWLDDDAFLDSPRATPDQLVRFHDPAYVDAVIRAERDQTLSREDRERFNIGVNGNPIYGEIFRRPATACGASIAAARLLKDGGIVHSPAGGTHHGRPDRASGFCYFNDPALGILAMLDGGLSRIAYVDIDAHHGDGVQDAFADDPRVLTVSVHEQGRWPGTGGAEDRAGGAARNLPVPPGFNDSEFRYVLKTAILPLVDAFAPDALVVQCGADALLEDPLSKLALSNNAHFAAIRALKPMAQRLLVLGGGGYNPWTVARCWAGVWAVLNDIPLPQTLPPAAEAVLRALTWNRREGRDPPDHWMTTLVDPARDGPVGAAVRQSVATAMAGP